MSTPPASQPRPRNLGLLAGAITILVLALIVITEGGEPVALVFPGETFDNGPLVEEFGRDAIPERFPYDGTRTYQLAKHFPDIEAAYDEGVADFRMTRVLQASIASVFGTGTGVLLALAALSVIGVGIATWALADLAQRHGRDPRLGLAALVALALPAAITTTEPLAFGLALAGLAMFDRDRLVAATAFFAAAGLGRETALAAALAAALVLLARRRVVAAALVGALSAAPYALWAAYVSSRIPETTDPTTKFLGFLDIPDAVGAFDITLAIITALLLVVGVVTWRDVPTLAITSGMFLAACLVYIGDQYRWHGFVRVSALGVALGLAGGLGELSARARRDERPSADRTAPTRDTTRTPQA